MELGEKLLERSNKTIYRSKDGKYLIKVFNHNFVPKSDVLAEAVNQARVEELNTILIPSIEEVFKVGEDWAIASEYIEGKTLEELLKEDPSKAKEYIEHFALLQIQMHKTYANRLTSVKRLLQERIDATKEVISGSSRYELHSRLNTLPYEAHLVHFDYIPSNIIVTSDNKWYVLDWAHARKGQVEADVALTYLNFILDNEKDLAEMYLKAYLKKSDVAKQAVMAYLPLIATYKLSRGGLSQENTKYLESLTDVADYE